MGLIFQAEGVHKVSLGHPFKSGDIARDGNRAVSHYVVMVRAEQDGEAVMFLDDMEAIRTAIRGGGFTTMRTYAFGDRFRCEFHAQRSGQVEVRHGLVDAA